ncbi:unnamed protein product, partial [Polarella glacialis]
MDGRFFHSRSSSSSSSKPRAVTTFLMDGRVVHGPQSDGTGAETHGAGAQLALPAPTASVAQASSSNNHNNASSSNNNNDSNNKSGSTATTAPAASLWARVTTATAAQGTSGNG